MKIHFLTFGLIFLLLSSCNDKKRFDEDISSRIREADKIEFRLIKSGVEESFFIEQSNDLDPIKFVLVPMNLTDVKLLDPDEFPVYIFLYTDNKITAELGIEFGHLLYVYYKIGNSFEFKARLDDRLMKFIQTCKPNRYQHPKLHGGYLVF